MLFSKKLKIAYFITFGFLQITLNSLKEGINMVEATGIEPATSWSQTTRATNCATPRS